MIMISDNIHGYRRAKGELCDTCGVGPPLVVNERHPLGMVPCGDMPGTSICSSFINALGVAYGRFAARVSSDKPLLAQSLGLYTIEIQRIACTHPR